VDRNLIFADRDYLTNFHLLFVLKDGKIAEMHEHMDVSGAVRGGLPVFDAIKMET
jgi:ketosteroid isomerase-like protein